MKKYYLKREKKFKQFLLLYLLKSKIYKQIIKKKNLSIYVKYNLIKLLINLKKFLQIIFNYHSKHKTILFIGLPDNLSSKINESTIHFALPKYYNIKGGLSNVSRNALVKDIKMLGLPDKLYKPYLIVILKHVNINYLIKESYSNKIPLIYFNSNEKKIFYRHNYYSISFYSDSLIQFSNFFVIGLNFLFRDNNWSINKMLKFVNGAIKKKKKI